MINKIWDKFLEIDNLKKEKWFQILEWFIKNEYNSTFSPEKENIFKMFELLKPDEIKGVFMFQDPYPQKDKKEKPIANGIGLAAPYLTGSLKYFYLAINNNYDLSKADTSMLNFIRQGIFCTNKYLSVGKEPLSHNPLNYNINGNLLRWDKFTEHWLNKMNQNFKGLFYVFFGKEAQELSNIINNKNNLVLKVSHSSPNGKRYGLLESNFAEKINNYLNYKII